VRKGSEVYLDPLLCILKVSGNLSQVGFRFYSVVYFFFQMFIFQTQSLFLIAQIRKEDIQRVGQADLDQGFINIIEGNDFHTVPQNIENVIDIGVEGKGKLREDGKNHRYQHVQVHVAVHPLSYTVQTNNGKEYYRDNYIFAHYLEECKSGAFYKAVGEKISYKNRVQSRQDKYDG
jgi:hypothetical protein